jgi:hypothetical protein
VVELQYTIHTVFHIVSSWWGVLTLFANDFFDGVWIRHCIKTLPAAQTPLPDAGLDVNRLILAQDTRCAVGITLRMANADQRIPLPQAFQNQFNAMWRDTNRAQ